jgi:hypothetical protein
MAVGIPGQTVGAVKEGILPAQVMLRFLKSSVMQERRDWNAMGPKLPVWFREFLEEIDPDLVLQFVPPRPFAKGGCDPTQHPFGVWAICRRMPQTGWLFKRHVFDLSTPQGLPCPPTRDLCEMLLHSRGLWRTGKLDQLESLFDRAMAAKQRSAVEASRARLHERIEKRLSGGRVAPVYRPQIFVPGRN